VEVFVSVMLEFFGFLSRSSMLRDHRSYYSTESLCPLRSSLRWKWPARSYPRPERSFNADARTTKVNLGVGVYFDDNGKIPLLAAVKAAEDTRVKAALPRGYQPIEGNPAYNTAVQNCCSARIPNYWPTARSLPPRPSAAPAP
jgi:hypothetical protein